MAALRTMSEIAKVLGYPEDIKKYNNILQRGKKAYERKLWNGKWSKISIPGFSFGLNIREQVYMLDNMKQSGYL